MPLHESIVGSVRQPLVLLLGAAAFVLLEEWLSAITIYWHFLFGALLILVVLFWRGGLNGLVDWVGRAAWRKRS